LEAEKIRERGCWGGCLINTWMNGWKNTVFPYLILYFIIHLSFFQDIFNVLFIKAKPSKKPMHYLRKLVFSFTVGGIKEKISWFF
jgi:hypothetical protein